MPENNFSVIDLVKRFSTRSIIFILALFFIMATATFTLGLRASATAYKKQNIQLTKKLDSISTEMSSIRLKLQQTSRKDSLMFSSLHINAAVYELQLTGLDKFTKDDMNHAIAALDSLTVHRK